MLVSAFQSVRKSRDVVQARHLDRQAYPHGREGQGRATQYGVGYTEDMELFTDDYIEALEPAELIDGFAEQESDYFDAYNIGTGGTLGIRVRLYDDKKDWFLEYHIGGTLRRMLLGHYPKTSLAQARKRAAARLSEIN